MTFIGPSSGERDSDLARFRAKEVPTWPQKSMHSLRIEGHGENQQAQLRQMRSPAPGPFRARLSRMFQVWCISRGKNSRSEVQNPCIKPLITEPISDIVMHRHVGAPNIGL